MDMSSENFVTEEREVSGFDRVSMSNYGELIIIQGESEALTIEAHDADTLSRIYTKVSDGELAIGIRGTFMDRVGDVLSTGLGGQRIRYSLTVKELKRLFISGAARVTASDLKTDHLAIKLTGAGSVRIKGLRAGSLQIDLPGAGKIELAGYAEEQKAQISGAGHYMAAKLESRKASVILSGAGKAIVWTNDDLQVKITGLGSVDYYGSPEVKQEITGLGNVVRLGNP
jgi:hypothetical protein